MVIELDLDLEDDVVTHIVLRELKEQQDIILRNMVAHVATEDDIKTLVAINQVIHYYTKPSQKEEG